MIISGCYTALATPFRNGVVDYAALKHILQMQIEAIGRAHV